MKLLAVDGNSLLNRAFYGIRLLTNKDGRYTNAIYGFMNILLKIQEEISPDLFAICFDVSRTTFRNGLYDQYKAGRKQMPEELAQQLPVVKELLGLLGYPVLGAEGFEADDLLGTFAKRCEEEKAECVIATGDRDSFQLIGDYVTVRLASTKQGSASAQIIDRSAIFEMYGVSPEKMIEIKAIMGDPSDHIPGVAGIGEKGAVKLIGAYGDIDTIYERLDALDIAPGMKKKLAESKEMAYLSRTLATIRTDVPVDPDLSHYAKKPGDPARAAALLAELEMFQMLGRLDLPAAAPEENAKISEPGIALTLLTMNEFFGCIAPGKPLAIWHDDAFSQFAYCIEDAGKLMVCDDSDPDFFQSLLSCGAAKTVYDAKELYRYGLSRGCTVSGIENDLLLAAYLLSPSSTGYALDHLIETYLPQNEKVEGGVGIAASMARLGSLLANKLEESGLTKLLGQIELPLSAVLASMEHSGFTIDAGEIEAFGAALDSEAIKLEAMIYAQCAGPFNINSPKQLGTILFEKLGLPAAKKTKTGYSTSAEVLEELRPQHPVIDMILQYRQKTKLRSTYTTALIALADEHSRVHSHFIQTETRTGRISSVQPNLQNIPVRTEQGREIRKFFKAKDGYTLVDADYSQIELRVLAHMADDQKMIEAFGSGVDIHTKTASEVFGVPVEEVNELLRRRAKAVNFGIVYGIGAFSLSKDIGVSVAEAKEYIENYLKTYAGVRAFMQQAVESAGETGYSLTLFGRRRYIPELKASNKMQQAFGSRVAMNSPIQGTAADIIKIAMNRVYAALSREQLDAKLILQVHDELIVECRKEIAGQVRTLVTREMEKAAALQVPLIADAHIGETWYKAKG